MVLTAIDDGHSQAARLEEGDLLEADVTPGGIALRPQKLMDAAQAWSWAPEWQQGEHEADTDLEAGRAERFESGEVLVESLRGRAKPSA